MNNKEIARRIGSLREKLGITTAELARRSGLSQAQVSRLENGKQGFRSATLARIAKALEVKPVYFFIEDTANVEEGAPVYGLAAGGELVEALRSPEFVRVAERLADAFMHQRQAFEAIDLAVKAMSREDEED